MKITIEDTEGEYLRSEHQPQGCCIWIKRDDLNMSELSALLSAACLACGYTPDAVLNHIRTDDHPPFPAVHGGRK